MAVTLLNIFQDSSFGIKDLNCTLRYVSRGILAVYFTLICFTYRPETSLFLAAQHLLLLLLRCRIRDPVIDTVVMHRNIVFIGNDSVVLCLD